MSKHLTLSDRAIIEKYLAQDVGVHGCYGYRCKRCSEDRICTSICDSYENSNICSKNHC